MFDPAFQLTLKNEGGFFHNPETGEIVNRGITLTFVRDCGYCNTADEQYIKDLTEQQTEEIYRKYFWERYNIGRIEDQGLANKVFDLTVNMGPGCATHDGALTLLQKAINDCGGKCAIDAELGPRSVGQINELDARRLLTAFRQRAKARYEEIAAKNPKLAGNLEGWLSRLDS